MYLKPDWASSEWPQLAALLKVTLNPHKWESGKQLAMLFLPRPATMCARVVFTLFTSYQQANGPRAADGRDSPVQETESRETTTGTTCKEEKLR